MLAIVRLAGLIWAGKLHQATSNQMLQMYRLFQHKAAARFLIKPALLSLQSHAKCALLQQLSSHAKIIRMQAGGKVIPTCDHARWRPCVSSIGSHQAVARVAAAEPPSLPHQQSCEGHATMAALHASSLLQR